MNVHETSVTEALRRWRIIPVIVIEDPKNAPNVGAALMAGGLPIAEITLRTRGALESLKRIKGEQPEMFAGCGTVLNVAQAKEVKAAGAEFVISPGFNRAVVDYCLEQELPVFPGVATASEIEAVLVDRAADAPARELDHAEIHGQHQRQQQGELDRRDAALVRREAEAALPQQDCKKARHHHCPGIA